MTVWLKFYELADEKTGTPEAQPTAVRLDAFVGLSDYNEKGLSLYYRLPGKAENDFLRVHGAFSDYARTIEVARPTHAPNGCGPSLCGIINTIGSARHYQPDSRRYNRLVPTDQFFFISTQMDGQATVAFEPLAQGHRDPEAPKVAHREVYLAEPTSDVIKKMEQAGHRFIQFGPVPKA